VDSTCIVCCDSLLSHLEAAQVKMGTNYPVYLLDRALHSQPQNMRQRLIDVLNALPESITTVLIAMGYCGGSLDNICARQRLVIPNLDDCITMLLTKTDAQEGNLKQRGHMYFRDSECGGVNVQRMLDNLRQEYGMERGTGIFGMWFADYTHADIIDTGVFDCYEESYVESIQKQADLIRCELGYVEGSNRILEKLVSGQWDEQFLIVPSGTVLTKSAFSLGEEFQYG
jgi:hypothetical protein